MTGQGITVEVTVHDVLADVIARIRRLDEGAPVRIAIPPGSALLLTATEFRALKDALQGRPVAISSEDPLRQQLAGMFGLAAPAGPRPTVRGHARPPGAEAPPQHSPTGESDQVVPAAATGPGDDEDTSSEAPDSRLGIMFTSIRHRLPRATNPTASGQATTPGNDASQDLPPEEPSQTGGLRSALARVVANPSIDRLRAGLRWHPPARRGGRPSGRMIASVLGVILVAAALAVGAAVLFLPRATVAITLKQQPVRGELIYAVLPPGQEGGQGVAFTVAGQPIEQEVTYEAAIPATGSRVEPDAPASGTVRLSNPNTEEITLDAGSTMTSDTGLVYAFAEAVVVPPAVPDEDRFGSAVAPVTAVEGGTAGNLDTGELSGQLESGVYFSNRDAPLTGGTDKTVPVVTAEDLAKLREQAEAELPALAEREVVAKLTDGSALVPGSLQVGDIRPDFAREEGESADTVTIRATAPITALAYRPAEATAQATDQLRALLTAQVPAGYTLDTPSLMVSGPAAVNAAEEQRFRITAEGRALAAFPEAERAQLTRRLAGKNPDDASEILRGQPNIERFRVTYGPDWLPDRMPSSANRIDLTLTG